MVIGCRRTANAAKYKPGTIIICWKCSRLAPAELKEYRRWRKLVDKAEARGVAVPHIEAKFNAAWDKLVEAATEIRVGIRGPKSGGAR